MVTSSARTVRSIVAGQTVHTASVDMSAQAVGEHMRQHKLGAVLVLDGERLAGIFTERDALFRIVAAGLDPTATSIAEVMTPDPVTIHPDKTFERALDIMHSGKFRHVPVVEGDQVLGLVSSLDAMGEEQIGRASCRERV